MSERGYLPALLRTSDCLQRHSKQRLLSRVARCLVQHLVIGTCMAKSCVHLLFRESMPGQWASPLSVRYRCLEGLFDTFGTFGTTFNNNLTLGGPTPIGARKAALSPQAYAYMEEVALNEQARLRPLPGAGCNSRIERDQ